MGENNTVLPLEKYTHVPLASSASMKRKLVTSQILWLSIFIDYYN